MRVGAKMHASSSCIFSGDGESESIFNDSHVECKNSERALRTDVNMTAPPAAAVHRGSAFSAGAVISDRKGSIC